MYPGDLCKIFPRGRWIIKSAKHVSAVIGRKHPRHVQAGPVPLHLRRMGVYPRRRAQSELSTPNLTGRSPALASTHLSIGMFCPPEGDCSNRFCRLAPSRPGAIRNLSGCAGGQAHAASHGMESVFLRKWSLCGPCRALVAPIPRLLRRRNVQNPRERY